MSIIWCISITNNVKSYKKNHWNSSNGQFQWFPIDLYFRHKMQASSAQHVEVKGTDNKRKCYLTARKAIVAIKMDFWWKIHKISNLQSFFSGNDNAPKLHCTFLPKSAIYFLEWKWPPTRPPLPRILHFSNKKYLFWKDVEGGNSKIEQKVRWSPFEEFTKHF